MIEDSIIRPGISINKGVYIYSVLFSLTAVGSREIMFLTGIMFSSDPFRFG